MIEKAIRALMDNQRVDEREAYEHMRSRATRLRVSVAEVATMIVEASEAMENSAWAARRRAPGTAENRRPHMKVLIARMNHETNTFSPVPTPLSAFGNDGPTYDAAAYAENKGKRTAMSAFIDLAEARGAELVTPVSATAYPSGRVDGAATGNMRPHRRRRAGLDALLLDSHGAMAVETTDDGEGDLLERLRRAAPGVPVAVALDLHGNVTQKMVDNADVIISFKTYPHVDMYETGEHAGRILFDWLAGGPRPALAWRLPLMTHTLRSATAEGAMREAVQAARLAEQGAVLGVSVLAGFALADIPAPCLSVVAVGAGEAGRAAAERAVTALADAIWANRDGFYYRSEPLADSLARAAALAEGADKPVLLLDHGDNCMSGGTCDTMDVLMAALDAGLTGIQAGLYCDPEAVAAMARAAWAPRWSCRWATAAHRRHRPRRAGDAARRGARAHQWRVRDHRPDYTGQTACMGPSAVLDLGAAQLVLTSRTHEPLGPGRVRKPGPGPARRALRAGQVAHVLPAGVRADFQRAGRVRQPGRHQLGLRPVRLPAPPAAAVSAGADGAAGLSRPGLNGGPLSCPMAACGRGVRPRPDRHTGRKAMATVRLLSDEEVRAIPEAWAVFEDIRATRKSDFVNNFWRAWPMIRRSCGGSGNTLKQVMMADGELSPLVRELIYIAVSTANGCGYCIHSHTAAARAKGRPTASTPSCWP